MENKISTPRKIALTGALSALVVVLSVTPLGLIPIGVASITTLVEFIMAGASAVQVGTATFANPNAMIEIIDGLKDFMKRKGYENIEQFRGIIQKN